MAGTPFTQPPADSCTDAPLAHELTNYPTKRRRLLRMVGAGFTAAVVGAASVVLLSQPAHAVESRLVISSGMSNCPAGYVCLWTGTNFSGTGYAFYNDESNYAALPSPFNGVQNNSLSFYNNGYAGSWEDVKLYRHEYASGDRIALCRGDSIAVLPSNSSMPSSSAEPGRGWRDHVTSHTWGNYCS